MDGLLEDMTVSKMHELFTIVLSRKDLSKAGDLFSVSDSEIVDDLADVLTEIEPIISQQDYLKNTNNQSVVEICLTRILSCIRETKTAERYCPDLARLLEICLRFNLQPQAANKDADPPHAKIAADIISSVFLNYDKNGVMRYILPVAVKFLLKGNKEISKSLASCLSLASIEYAYLLSPHTQVILDAIDKGNYGLCRVLPQIYEVSSDVISEKIPKLVVLLAKCDSQEKLALLQLFACVANKKPTSLESSVPVLCEYLTDPVCASGTMQILLKLAETRPNLIVKYFDKIKDSTTETLTTIAVAAQILATAGKISKDKAQYALDFVLEHLPHADRTSQTILLHEATKLCSSYPALFTDRVLQCVRQKNLLSQQQTSTNQLNSSTDILNNKSNNGITIVKLNSPPPPAIPTPSLPSGPQSIGAIGTMSRSSNTTNTKTSTLGPFTKQRNSRSSPSSPKELKRNAKLPPYNNNKSALGGHILTIHTSTASSNSTTTAPTSPVGTPVVPPTPPHTGYTRRVKLGDSRSTGRLHPAGNSHRSGSVGGLHKSMTKLSSSQQINQNGNGSNTTSRHNVATTVVGVNNNVTVSSGTNKGSKVSSGGVTVTTSHARMRPHSQGPITLVGSTGALVKYSNDAINQSTGSIASPVLINQPTSSHFFSGNSNTLTLPVNTDEVIISGPTTNVTPRRNDNTSYTLLNTMRMSTFEPYQITRDPVQQFCEKNFLSIKKYMDQLSQFLPPPTRCSIEERRTKKVAKLHFACQVRGPHCLYNKTCFTMRTRSPKTWIHLMFLDFQVRHYVKEKTVLSTRESGISSLKHIWEILKCETRNFTELVTSVFPNIKDREILVNELRHSGFLDVFEVSKTDQSKPNANELEFQWACFLCNNPDKAEDLLSGSNHPMIEGDLKEKKGKWRLFRRWRTRYFTLSGAHLSCKGSSAESIDVNQIRSVKVSRGARNIPKAFEIFTGDQTVILKPKDGKKAEEWVKCLSIAVAQSQARDNPNSGKTNSLPMRGLGNSKSTF